MTDIEIMTIVWIITMVLLGLAWQRMAHWKARHDFDHKLAQKMHALVQSMEPTPRTWEVLAHINKDEDFKVVLVKEDA